MAIHNLTTIQDSNLLYDAYINEALANLGQRQGAHGDSINLESFMIGDIIDVTGVQDYINVGVSNPEENITLEFTSSTGESLEYIKNNSQEAQTEITPIEYIGEASKSEKPVKFGNVKVDKYTKDNEYFLFKGVLNIDDIETYIVVLQIPINDYNSNINNNCNGILITDKWILKYSSSDVYLHTATLDEIKERIYDEFNNIDSVDALYNELKKDLTKPSYTINVEYFQNKFIYYFAVLPSYINRFYNNNNILLNGETTLRQSIFNELIKIITTFAFSNSIEDDITENKLDDNYVVKISKDFKFNYFVNSNTKEYLYSLDIPVLYTETPDKININSNYIVAYSVYNKVSNFKFTVNYTGSANNETTEDTENKNITISVSKEYTLPYIATVVETDENDNIIYDTNHIAETKEVWFVNDVPTNVSPIGKDAGNPNIMLMVYDYDTTVTDGSVNPSIKVKHTFSDKQVRNIKELFTDIDYTNTNTFNTIELSYKFDSNKANLTDQQTEVLGNSEYTLFTYDLPIVSIDVLKQYKYIWEVIAKNTLVMLSIDSRFLTIPNGDKFTSLHNVINAGTDTTSYVTVFLHIVKKEEETNTNVERYEWEIINNETLTDDKREVALDLGSMLGIQNLVNYYTNTKYEPDTYFFDHLVFEKINSEIKQEQVNETTFIFPVLKVDNGTYYDQNNTNGANDANFVPKFLLNSFVNYESDFSGNRIKEINDNPQNDDRLQELFVISTDNQISDVLKSSVSNDYIPANGSATSSVRDYFKDIYPIFDFREVITNNQTGLNRISLMGVNSDKTVYHGYFGHDATNANNFDILTIGSSTTNWTLSNNLTVTADYDNFAKYAKLRLDMPTEETKLLFNKYDNGKYFSIVTLDFSIDAFKQYINEVEIKRVVSPYVSSPIPVKIIEFNATTYINSRHSEYVNGGNDIKVRLQGNTKDDETYYSGLDNNLINVILYFTDNDTPKTYLQKYKLVGAEEIIKNTNYKLNFNTSANTIDTDEPITE